MPNIEKFIGNVGVNLIIPWRVEPDHSSPLRSLLGDGLLSVLELVAVPRGFQGAAVHRDLCFEYVLVGGQARYSPVNLLGQFLLHFHGVVGVLVHVDGAAGCLLKGSLQACLQVEVGYFDVDLGGITQAVLRKCLTTFFFSLSTSGRPCTVSFGMSHSTFDSRNSPTSSQTSADSRVRVCLLDPALLLAEEEHLSAVHYDADLLLCDPHMMALVNTSFVILG